MWLLRNHCSMLTLTPQHVSFLNERLTRLAPPKIIEWALTTLPGLYQTTAFGLTGLVITHMISELLEASGSDGVPLIFIDTLHHFPETLELVNRVRARYGVEIHTFRPSGTETKEEFVHTHGEKLWERDESAYDYLVKVEPAQRAYTTLNANAVFTGRRRSQKGARETIPIIEIDSTGLIKINPLADWTFSQVEGFVRANDVPYNPLLDLGYLSIGDTHSTLPAKDRNDERSGRWAGQAKTECGLHKDYFKMRESYLNSVTASTPSA
ncbi:3'-phosphoadenylsulfate reductase [Entomophthora muscae]|uniref:3'-phosphoadenylsulfate reductase n=1 Tax=Entomophthora muscae TaxID=34485 RepID=A0ACC2S9H7_9FUNG|nr:3'-phosphoadenylsulfate reductase [Entomophthora muscae]